MWKKMRLKSVVLQSQKKLQALEKTFFRKKKILPPYLCRYDLQNGVRKFFFKQIGLEIFKFG